LNKQNDILSDEELMQRVQNEDRDAFNEIYLRYSTPLLRFMYRLLNHDEAIAQDKLHDIFLKVIEHPKKFDTSRKFKPWIYTIAANECKKHYRHSSKMDSFENQPTDFALEPNLIEKLELSNFNADLSKALIKMSYQHQSVFALRFIEKFSIKEIGQILNCPTGTVKSRIHHTLKILSQKLKLYNPINDET